MKKNAIVGVVLAALAAVPIFTSTPASACGTSIRQVVDNKAMLISSAERKLSEGNFVAAAAEASNAFPGLKKFPIATGPLADRALRILALAVVRTEGGLTVAAMRGTNDTEKAQNLAWAVTTLRGLNAKRPNNPSLQTDLGEALAKTEGTKPEAAKLLAGLADRDLMASAEGYAALAKIRETSGDAAGRDAALKRCTGMTKSAKVCRISGVEASSRS
jgi:hypothetical protein